MLISIVTITANSTVFKGFLLEAREVGGSNPMGIFTLMGNNTQLLACSSQSNSSVSHISDASKLQIQSKWKAPSSGNSKNIEFSTAAPTQALSKAQQLHPLFITETGSMSAISNAGCGSNKTCFSDPSGCDPSSNSKCYFMSAAQSASGAPYKFEIVGGADGYVSIGFSDDKEMGNDDIYICGKDSNGNIQLQHAFSTGTTTPGNIALGNVSGFSSSLINGVISCSFTSGNPISTTRSSSSQSSYYVFLAYGATQRGVIQMHSTTPFISSSKMDFSTITILASGEQRENNPSIVKAHGCLMLIAWMTTGSIGMLIARYLKNAAKRTKFCGKDFWFGAHVFLMILSVAATIIAFILVFSYARDWSGGAHPVLGVIVMILSLAQPIAAMFRCGPQDERRYIFNWAHTINALAIKGLAVAAIFTGLALVDSSEQQWLQKVMGGFVAWEAIWFLCQDFQQRRKKNDIILQESDQVIAESLLLVAFFIGNIAFLVALLVGIGNS
ncbi:putative ferric-chelate reductase 1 [Pygocentrus nattereri]|uniref:putative ferric-chelate reductase 1 n=1 Tax=Pygocentrus nattereri TaxID=42514 RepID=UPI001890C141|nr:putative ferric-chelate reductase 1 [Pygocentrus nattereri]